MTKISKLPSKSTRLDKEGNLDLQTIPKKDKTKYLELAKSLVITDVNSILNFGKETQLSMEKYSSDFLSTVRTINSGEIGGLINNLLTELNYIDVSQLEQSRFKSFVSRIPLLKSLVTNTKKLFQKYDVVVSNINKITDNIKIGQANSLKDNTNLQSMFDSNVEYIKDMEDLIISGELKKAEINGQLSEMESNPSDYNDYEIADLRDFENRLDKRLADMKVVRHIMLQSLAQIRVVQNNNTAIAEKAQSIISTTIPVWKNQLGIAISLNRQKAAAEMQTRISDTTNTILNKNSEMLKLNSIAVAQENEKTIVSIETLRNTTTNLVATLNEVKQIHEAGNQNRLILSNEINGLEVELKKNVTKIDNKQQLKLQ